MYGWSGWDVFSMVVAMVAFWGGLAAIVWMITRSNDRRGPQRTPPPPADVLRRRFAEGAISADEFRERLRVLEETAPVTP